MPGVLTADDVAKVTFEKVKRGYNTEDVDDFLQHLAARMAELENELEALKQETTCTKDAEEVAQIPGQEG